MTTEMQQVPPLSSPPAARDPTSAKKDRTDARS